MGLFVAGLDQVEPKIFGSAALFGQQEERVIFQLRGTSAIVKSEIRNTLECRSHTDPLLTMLKQRRWDTSPGGLPPEHPVRCCCCCCCWR